MALKLAALAIVAALVPAAAMGAGCAPAPFPPTARFVVQLQRGDLLALSQTIFGEARGEPDSYCAMAAIAHVIINRVRTDPQRWGATISQVVNKPYQFSVWGKRDPNRARLLKVDESDPSFILANMAAFHALAGAPDPTGGAVYFINKTMSPRPRWTLGMRQTARIGSHVFYAPK